MTKDIINANGEAVTLVGSYETIARLEKIEMDPETASGGFNNADFGSDE